MQANETGADNGAANGSGGDRPGSTSPPKCTHQKHHVLKHCYTCFIEHRAVACTKATPCHKHLDRPDSFWEKVKKHDEGLRKRREKAKAKRAEKPRKQPTRRKKRSPPKVVPPPSPPPSSTKSEGKQSPRRELPFKKRLDARMTGDDSEQVPRQVRSPPRRKAAERRRSRTPSRRSSGGYRCWNRAPRLCRRQPSVSFSLILLFYHSVSAILFGRKTGGGRCSLPTLPVSEYIH